MFAERLGHHFRDPRLLALALAHPSTARETEADPLLSNERLEFLGDAVLQLAVSAALYDDHPDGDEGRLTTLRSAVVREQALSRAAAEIGLGAALTLGPAADQAGSRARRSVLACGLEAVFGAVYLDAGWDAARACVLRVLEGELEGADGQRHRNHKGVLQELTQERFRQGPEYRLLDLTGPAHDRRFVVEVLLGERVLATGRGMSKKEAEQAAAAAAIEALAGEGGQER